VVGLEDEVEALVGVEVEAVVEVEVDVVVEVEAVVEVELVVDVLDVAVPTASENVPMTGSLLPSPEYAPVILSGDAEGEGV